QNTQTIHLVKDLVSATATIGLTQRVPALWQRREFRPTQENIMGFFSKILSKLGIGDAEAASAPAADTTTSAAPAAAAQTAPVEVVDVVAQLEQRAAQNTQKLNWRTSIVDLLKLLELDSSFAAR